MMPSESAYGKISQEVLYRFASIVLCFRQYAVLWQGWMLWVEEEGKRHTEESLKTKLIIIRYKPRCSNCMKLFHLLRTEAERKIASRKSSWNERGEKVNKRSFYATFVSYNNNSWRSALETLFEMKRVENSWEP